jgi:hypothetical protein
MKIIVMEGLAFEYRTPPGRNVCFWLTFSSNGKAGYYGLQDKTARDRPESLNSPTSGLPTCNLIDSFITNRARPSAQSHASSEVLFQVWKTQLFFRELYVWFQQSPVHSDWSYPGAHDQASYGSL